MVNAKYDFDLCSSDDSKDESVDHNNMSKQIPDHSSKNGVNTEMNIGNASNSGDLGSSNIQIIQNLCNLFRISQRNPTDTNICQVLDRAGKSTGQYRHWLDVRSLNDKTLNIWMMLKHER